LSALVDNPPSWQVQLYALNALTFIGDRAQPVLASVERVRGSTDNEYVRSASKYLALKLTGAYTPNTPIFDFGRLMRRAEDKT